MSKNQNYVDPNNKLLSLMVYIHCECILQCKVKPKQESNYINSKGTVTIQEKTARDKNDKITGLFHNQVDSGKYEF